MEVVKKDDLEKRVVAIVESIPSQRLECRPLLDLLPDGRRRSEGR